MPDDAPWRSIASLPADPGAEPGRGGAFPAAPAAEPGRGGGALAMPTDEATRKAVVAAYSHLARRSYTRKEMGQKLARAVESAEAVEAALDWLVARRLLDDRRLADEGVRAAIERKGWGRRKVQQWLQGRGIDAETAQAALAEVEPEGEAAQAAALAERQRARGKRPEQVYRFLLSRGFPSSIAREAALHGDEE